MEKNKKKKIGETKTVLGNVSLLRRKRGKTTNLDGSGPKGLADLRAGRIPSYRTISGSHEQKKISFYREAPPLWGGGRDRILIVLLAGRWGGGSLVTTYRPHLHVVRRGESNKSSSIHYRAQRGIWFSYVTPPPSRTAPPLRTAPPHQKKAVRNSFPAGGPPIRAASLFYWGEHMCRTGSSC